MTEAFSILCISRQDWGAALPTNRQQIMLRAAERGHRVLFIENGGHIGRHLARLATGPGRRSLARRLLGGEQVAEGITVRKGIALAPWGQKFALANRVNARVTAGLIRRRARDLSARRVLWLYDPCAFELAGGCGETFAVYDCVDDYAEQVGPDPRRRRFVAAADGEAAARSEVVFATTRGLYERQRARNDATHLVPNGADFSHFAGIAPGEAAPEVESLPQPVVGFAGNLTAEKVDFDFLEALARSRPEWSFALIGPAAQDARSAVRRLGELANVHVLGQRPYGDLLRYVAGFAVGIVPYRESAYTRNCSPLKVFEYLAAGKAVVASGVPELAGMEPDVTLAVGTEEFGAAIERALADSGPEAVARRRALAGQNTWDARAERLLGLVRERFAG
jgi:glycosyltransferase involved in cell wall biosynthesis